MLEIPHFEPSFVTPDLKMPDGATYVVEAPQRRGKTLTCVVLAFEAFVQERPVFSTIPLSFPHKPIDFNEMVLPEGESPYHGGHILIDEWNFFFDCRRSLNESNIEHGSFLLQQKKQGCNLMGTTHSVSSLDGRLRDNFDYLITPRVYPAFPAIPEWLVFTITNTPLQPRCNKTFKVRCAPFLKMYNTRRIQVVKRATKKERFSL